jgi:CheY-like chemotaxis protein
VTAGVADDVSTGANAQRPVGKVAARHLLLAEDNAICQKVLIAMLLRGGYTLDTVRTGVAVLAAVADRNYDAIIMDCQLPKLSGYDATAAIRAQEGLARHTPIIALTASARREDRERCLAAGMDSYLAKPVSREVLLALLARTVQNDAPATPTPPTGRPAVTEVAIDGAVSDKLSLLAAHVPGVLAELIDQFVRETEPRLVGLRAALEAGDAGTAGSISHLIKESGSQLGGRRLVLSCDRLKATAWAGLLPEATIALPAVEFDFQELCEGLQQLVDTAEEQASRLYA